MTRVSKLSSCHAAGVAQINLSLDGGEVLHTQVPNMAAYDVLAVGVAFSGAMSAGTFEAWIDDVAVSMTSIGFGG